MLTGIAFAHLESVVAVVSRLRIVLHLAPPFPRVPKRPPEPAPARAALPRAARKVRRQLLLELPVPSSPPDEEARAEGDQRDDNERSKEDAEEAVTTRVDAVSSADAVQASEMSHPPSEPAILGTPPRYEDEGGMVGKKVSVLRPGSASVPVGRSSSNWTHGRLPGWTPPRLASAMPLLAAWTRVGGSIFAQRSGEARWRVVYGAAMSCCSILLLREDARALGRLLVAALGPQGSLSTGLDAARAPSWASWLSSCGAAARLSLRVARTSTGTRQCMGSDGLADLDVALEALDERDHRRVLADEVLPPPDHGPDLALGPPLTLSLLPLAVPSAATAGKTGRADERESDDARVPMVLMVSSDRARGSRWTGEELELA